MKKLLFAGIITILFSLSILAQTASFTTNIFKKDDGIAIVNATPTRQIGFIIKGNGITSEKKPSGLIIVENEGVKLTFLFIKKSEFLKVAKDKTDEGILEEYRNWDIAGTEEDLKTKIDVDIKRSEPLLISDIRKNDSLSTVPSVYWSFIVPGMENKRSSFQATLIDDLILLTASTYPDTEKSESVQQYLKDLFVTLAIMDPIAPKKPGSKTKRTRSTTR